MITKMTLMIFNKYMQSSGKSYIIMYLQERVSLQSQSNCEWNIVELVLWFNKKYERTGTMQQVMNKGLLSPSLI